MNVNRVTVSRREDGNFSVAWDEGHLSSVSEDALPHCVSHAFKILEPRPLRELLIARVALFLQMMRDVERNADDQQLARWAVELVEITEGKDA